MQPRRIFYGSVINASPNGLENGNADSPLNETERYNLTNRTQPRILGLAARGETLGEWGGLTLVLTPIVQPNIYFSYVNVLETFIILILGPVSKLGLRGGLFLACRWGVGKEGEMVEGAGTGLGTQPRRGRGFALAGRFLHALLFLCLLPHMS